MTLKFGSTTISTTDGNVTYNGNTVNKVIYNGTTIWEKQVCPVGTILYESSTAGSYSVSVPVNGTYQVIAVGAGGGAGHMSMKDGTSMARVDCASGGSGGYVNGTINLTAGQTLTGQVGALGATSGYNFNTRPKVTKTYSGSAGGDTTFIVNGTTKITAGGGGGGSSTVNYTQSGWTGASWVDGAKGTRSWSGMKAVSANSEGNNGTHDSQSTITYNTSITKTVARTASVYLTYGQGSGAKVSSDTKSSGSPSYSRLPGTDGYIKIIRTA